MKIIYTTSEWNGYGKQNYYHNEYRDEGDSVTQYRCQRFKSFDGDENSWKASEKKVDSWSKTDSNMPEWLRKHL